MARPLLDKEFLDELDRQKVKEIYARITALTMEEEPIEQIEGHITQGSVNIDGSSSVRRTCSLTLVANELNIHEFYWGLRTKFMLETGISNTINPKYPDIIWFNQGKYVLTSFNTSQTTSNYTISVQGKDKMTLLNGELGGSIYALTHNFGVEDVTDKDGYMTTQKLLVKDIIINAVHEFAKEPLHNIIVNDLDDYGLELLEYRGKDPMYCIIDAASDEPTNMTLDGNQQYSLEDGSKITLSQIPEDRYNKLFELDRLKVIKINKIPNMNASNFRPGFTYKSRDGIAWTLTNPEDTYDPNMIYGESVTPYVLYDGEGKSFTCAKLTYGMTAGYRLTGITYPGDLIANVGETVTSVLDKIKSMLGEFEYYYDVDGRFIFQRKKTYISTGFNNIVNNRDEDYVDPAAYTSAVSYSFQDSLLVSSYTNSPNYANLRNDFSIWGTRKSVTGKELDVHMRYAIDDKPEYYRNYYGTVYTIWDEETMRKYMRSNLDSFIPNNKIKEEIGWVRKENPPGLSYNWWDIFNWGEYYKIKCGHYPTSTMDHYLINGGYKFTADEMYNMFPKGSETYEGFLSYAIYCFDVEPDGTLGYTGHGTNCGHYYENYFLRTLFDRGATAYIYKPVIPEEDLLPGQTDEYAGQEYEDVVKEEIDKIEIIGGLDWRELIYQMAIDFRRHNHEDDFYITIRQMNPTTCPYGYTGYEQYYTDMEGFWRQLYCPTQDATAYKQTTPSKSTYLMRPGDYYYFDNTYAQCGGYEQYHEGMQYYTLKENTFMGYYEIQAIDLTADQYTSMSREKLFYICPFQIVNHKSETFELKPGTHYYSEDGGRVFKEVTGEHKFNINLVYATKAQELDPYTYINCMITEPYRVLDGKYYVKDGDNYTLVTGVTEEEYYKNPSKYYNMNKPERVIAGKKEKFMEGRQYFYFTDFDKPETWILFESLSKELYDFNCTSLGWKEYEYSLLPLGTTYDSSKTYYQKTTSSTTDLEIYVDVPMNENTFHNAVAKRNCYVRTGEILTFRCCELDPYDPTREYLFLRAGLGEYTEATDGKGKKLITDEETFNKFCTGNWNEKLDMADGSKGTLMELYTSLMPYYKKYSYQCCVHPKEYDPTLFYFLKTSSEYTESGWVQDVFDCPDNLNFWFDFLDEDSELSKYSVHSIGDRPKSVKDTNVKAIYFRETPTVVFVKPENWEKENNAKFGYTYIKLPEHMENLFSISTQGKSAKDVLDQYLYDFACCAESITISVLPIHHLVPNTRIFVYDGNSGINGEYIMTRYTIPLSHSGNMSITATKAIDALY